MRSDVWSFAATMIHLLTGLPPYPNAKLDKARRAAWIPFGDGAGLCPGRRIAMISHLALLSTLVCGYELEDLDGGVPVKRPETMPMGFGHGIIRPLEGRSTRVRIRRRSNWRDVSWRFDLGKTMSAEV